MCNKKNGCGCAILSVWIGNNNRNKRCSLFCISPFLLRWHALCTCINSPSIHYSHTSIMVNTKKKVQCETRFCFSIELEWGKTHNPPGLNPRDRRWTVERTEVQFVWFLSCGCSRWNIGVLAPKKTPCPSHKGKISSSESCTPLCAAHQPNQGINEREDLSRRTNKSE